MNSVGAIIRGAAGRLVASILMAALVVGHGEARAGSIRTLDGIGKTLVSREVTALSRAFFAAGGELEEHLDEFSHVLNLSDKSQLRAAIRDIERLESLHKEFQTTAEALNLYLTQNRKRLKAEGLDHFLALKELTGKNQEYFTVALTDYIATRKQFLFWTDDHFRDIMAGKEDALATFNQLSQDNDRVMEKEYDRYLERIDHLKGFMKKHPELASFAETRRAS